MKIKNQDPFNDLPQELTIEILSRLPVRTIIKSKCVCKSWRGLVESPLFASVHSRQAALSYAHLHAIEFSRAHSLLGFIDDNEVIHKPPKGSVLSHTFPNPYKPYIHSSVNGLLFMIDFDSTSELFICNPITREYVRIEMGHECHSNEYAFGFGVSKSGQYKIVRFYADWRNPLTCQVYNLGTGQWKSIMVEITFEFESQVEIVPPWVNGNLHWLILDLKKVGKKGIRNRPIIYCLDLETELFNYFSCPPGIQNCKRSFYYSLSNLEGRLCFSNDGSEDVFEIWCMKEYGDDKSWTKDYVIKRKPYMLTYGDILLNYFKFDIHNDPFPEFNIPYNLYIDNPIIIEIQKHEHNMLYPVKAFEDGGVLLALYPSARLFYYSNETKAIQDIKKERNYDYSNLVIHCPNFVSLKSLAMRGVESF
ncbi:putative F-box protein [Salvia divinorum]|uniref:F-box protein n=1 Tax=Salvia divinorum TaxID=28513 RepID=A0ABD1GU05_SALDI